MFSFFKKPKKAQPLLYKVAISTSTARIVAGFIECEERNVPRLNSVVKAKTANGEEIGRLLDLRAA